MDIVNNPLRLAWVLVLFTQISFAQLVINELDCDTPGVDNQEFIEIKSEVPNFPLDGYVVVMFNGSASGGNTSYVSLDLDGYETDINGLLLIGSLGVSPVPQYLISGNVIQNGADAIAIYQASDYDFPQGTLATTTNLIDVIIYGTDDAEATGLIDIFNDHPDFTDIQQINEGPGNNTVSIQLANDGTYYTATPTPRMLNDGSGIVLNGVSISTSQTQYNEGESFDITFTTEQNVSENLDIDFTLSNDGFDMADFTGSTTATIVSGQNTAVANITLVDDSLNEGDEVAMISFVSLPSGYLKLNNHVQIRIVDNDFTVAPFGSPLNPTYGVVESTAPNGYYDSAIGLSGNALRQALQDIIAEEGVVRAQTYADVTDILKQADQNPENSNQVWLVYTEQGRAKLDFQTGASNVGTWNREHTFPRSRGGFYDRDGDSDANGPDVFWTTNADSIRHGNSDAHHIRAVDGPENSLRGNQHYGQYNGPVGNAGSFKGDVARGLFYMEIRYNGLQLENGYPETLGSMGDLATLLSWHELDPADDFEMNRNNVVYTWQHNRNPFIDYPELVDYIWGDLVGQAWDPSLSVEDYGLSEVKVFPNPVRHQLFVSNLKTEAVAEIYSADGRLVKTQKVVNHRPIEMNVESGVYFLRIISEDKLITKKIMVQ